MASDPVVSGALFVCGCRETKDEASSGVKQSPGENDFSPLDSPQFIVNNFHLCRNKFCYDGEHGLSLQGRFGRDLKAETTQTI